MDILSLQWSSLKKWLVYEQLPVKLLTCSPSRDFTAVSNLTTTGGTVGVSLAAIAADQGVAFGISGLATAVVVV